MLAEAKIKLPSGGVVEVQGTPSEINEILRLYSGGGERNQPQGALKQQEPSGKPRNSDGLARIVELTKTCEEAEAIEHNILDRTSQVDRTLLPLYVAHEYLNDEPRLTSGEISKITTDLGIPVSQPNASRTLSGVGSRYVIGDTIRRRGQTVRYRLSRRGLQYVKSIIRGQ